MSAQERPRLRPHLTAVADRSDPRYVLVWDQLGLGDGPRRFTWQEYTWVQLLDGQRTLRDVQAEAVRRANGALLSLDHFSRLVERLDAALFLDGPRFRQRLADPVRPPSCLGCYEPQPEALRQQIRGLFTGKGGAGLPATRAKRGKERLRAALLPHIDYARGGACYTWGFKELFEQTDASLFLIIGTSHYSHARFTLTRKNFKTPLGIVDTDQDYIDRLVGHYGDGLFEDEVSHLPEHSIELEVVFLQYLYEHQRPIRIVPLVVGSFQDCIFEQRRPASMPDVRRMIEALRQTEQETPEPICYLISGDLAHLGPKFGDLEPVDAGQLRHSQVRDEELLRRAEAADADAYFELVADEDDRRRICGLPPTYTVLGAAQPRRGRALKHEQFIHPHGYESVSFASMAFYE